MQVVEYDEDGTAHKHASTLDSFEHSLKVMHSCEQGHSKDSSVLLLDTDGGPCKYLCLTQPGVWQVFVDFGLGLFALVNAGVKVEKVPHIHRSCSPSDSFTVASTTLLVYVCAVFSCTHPAWCGD